MNSICIVSYNRLNDLIQTLEGIDKYCTGEYEVVIVDNNSTDKQTQDYLVRYCANPKVPTTLILNKENEGPAKAFNKAFRHANGDILVHLDSDIVVPFEGWNVKLEEFLNRHDEVGLVGPDTPGQCLRLDRGDNFDETEFCLSGDTKIPLLDGTIKTMKELSELSSLDNIHTYSLDENSKIVPGRVLKAWKTGLKQTLKVTLDNGSSFKCTPNHRIMMRDGSYREAKDLKEKDSVMPLYTYKRQSAKKSPTRTYEQVYEWIYVPKYNKYMPTHVVIGRKKGVKGEVVHHKNYNSLDNNPTNLKLMSKENHSKIHTKEWTEEDREKWSKKIQKQWDSNFEGKAKISKSLLEAYASGKRVSWNKGALKLVWVVCAQCGTKKQRTLYKSQLHNIFFCSNKCHGLYLRKGEFIECLICGKEKYFTRDVLNKGGGIYCSHRCGYIGRKIYGKVVKNHKIKKIEHADIVDVYDMTIDTYHNFAILTNETRKDGVFVHNCLGGSWAMRKKDFERCGGWSEKNKDGGAVEVEHCYRLRMSGFRVGLLRDIYRVHLDTSAHDSTKYARGTFEFLKEVNNYHLGFFHYKSPAMLYWEDLPINVLFRKQVFARYGLNLNPEIVTLQNHTFELLKIPGTQKHFNELGLQQLVNEGIVMRGSDRFEDVPRELLCGNIKWNMEVERIVNSRRIACL